MPDAHCGENVPTDGNHKSSDRSVPCNVPNGICSGTARMWPPSVDGNAPKNVEEAESIPSSVVGIRKGGTTPPSLIRMPLVLMEHVTRAA